ncbi:MAG: stage II sporulation protein M [Imperialibacter sp.]
MKQSIFVKNNQAKWNEFESKLTNTGTLSSDELSLIYIHLTEDLAFAKANYPNTKLFTYLNALALMVHTIVYKNKKEEKGRFGKFWAYEVPLEIRRSYKYILIAFLITALGVSIGALSSANDETFVRLILGDAYVDMTLNNIKEGDPMGVYSSMDGNYMFMAITSNNIRVSFVAFALGLFFSVGAGWVLFQNGVMLGAFHYLFFKEGLFDDTILTIWLHGTIEIWSIIVAGAAGIVLGNGFLFPGTYPRIHSFQRGAKQAIKVVLGLFPFFIVAGFIESFVTRHTEWPLYLKLLIISLSLLLILFYFFYLPLKTNPHDHAKN